MNNFKKHLGLILLICIGIFFGPFSASAQTGTIDPGHSYAWGENMGWLNFAAPSGNITVTDTNLTGYFWSQNFGWVNLAPAGGGVTNTPSGTLGGTAWSETLGYIDFTGATIDGSGKFHGTIGSPSTTAGRITFDCTNCDVRTTWLANAAPTPTPTVSGGGGGGVILPITSPTPTAPGQTPTPSAGPTQAPGETSGSTPTSPQNPATNPNGGAGNSGTQNLSLVTCSGQAENVTDNNTSFDSGHPGTFIRNLSDLKKVTISFGGSGCFSQNMNFSIEQQLLSSVEQPSIDADLIGGYFFNINARNQNGLLVHNFPLDLQISILIPQEQLSGEVALYYFDETDRTWKIVPNAAIKNSEVDFTTSHLTKYGVFRVPGLPQVIPTNPVKTSDSFGLSAQTDKQQFSEGEKVTATINLTSATGTIQSDVRISVLDSSGKEVYADEYKREVTGSASIHEDLSSADFPPGEYTLKVVVLDGQGGEKDSSYNFTVLGSQAAAVKTVSLIKILWIALIVLVIIFALWLLIARRRNKNSKTDPQN